MGSAVVTHGLSCAGTIVVIHGLSCSSTGGTFPMKGLEWDLLTLVSCIGRQLLYHWATEALVIITIFLMWTIFKVFIEFITILPLFYIWGLGAQGMWDRSPSTRAHTLTPCPGRGSCNHWISREVPPRHSSTLVSSHSLCCAVNRGFISLIFQSVRCSVVPLISLFSLFSLPGILTSWMLGLYFVSLFFSYFSHMFYLYL